MVCCIRKYVITLGDIPVDAPPDQNIGGCVPGIPGGVDASSVIAHDRAVNRSVRHVQRALSDGWKWWLVGSATDVGISDNSVVSNCICSYRAMKKRKRTKKKAKRKRKKRKRKSLKRRRKVKRKRKKAKKVKRWRKL